MLGRAWNLRGRVALDPVVLEREVQHFPDEGQNPIGHDRCGPGCDLVDERPHVASGQLPDLPVLPVREEFDFEDALVLPPGFLPRCAVGSQRLGVALHVLPGELPEPLGQAVGGLLGRRIFAVRRSVQGVARLLARVRERQVRVDAECESAPPALRAVANNPDLPTTIGDAQPELGKARIHRVALAGERRLEPRHGTCRECGGGLSVLIEFL